MPTPLHNLFSARFFSGKRVRFLWLCGIVFSWLASPPLRAQTVVGAIPDQALVQSVGPGGQRRESDDEILNRSPAQRDWSRYIMSRWAIEVCLSLVSFDWKDLEAVARRSPEASVRAADVLALWRAGKGRLEMASTTRAGIGDQSTLKDVLEWRFPQCYNPTLSADPSVVSSNKNTRSAAFPDIPLTPGDFQTRESGIIFNFTITGRRDGPTFDTILVSEVTSKIEAEEMTSRSVSSIRTNVCMFAQPTFQNKTATMLAACTDGETIVINCDLLHQGRDEMRYLLITPHRMHPDPGDKEFKKILKRLMVEMKSEDTQAGPGWR